MIFLMKMRNENAAAHYAIPKGFEAGISISQKNWKI